MEKVKIVKVGDTAPMPTAAGRTKTVKTFPRGILKGGKTAKNKIQPVRDPAKPPPINPKKKATLKILTEKGAEKRRKRIKKTVRSMPDSKVRSVLRASGLPVSDKTPSHIAKEILEGGMEAGMIVVK
jgi:hypothetical protein